MNDVIKRALQKAGPPSVRKRRKYVALAEAHQFESIAVEIMGVYDGSTGVISKPPLLKQQGSPWRLTGSVKTWL